MRKKCRVELHPRLRERIFRLGDRIVGLAAGAHQLRGIALGGITLTLADGSLGARRMNARERLFIAEPDEQIARRHAVIRLHGHLDDAARRCRTDADFAAIRLDAAGSGSIPLHFRQRLRRRLRVQTARDVRRRKKIRRARNDYGCDQERKEQAGDRRAVAIHGFSSSVCSQRGRSCRARRPAMRGRCGPRRGEWWEAA